MRMQLLAIKKSCLDAWTHGSAMEISRGLTDIDAKDTKRDRTQEEMSLVLNDHQRPKDGGCVQHQG